MTDDAGPALVMLAAGMAKRYGGCKPLAPVGLHGEAVIDLNASDARTAGFGRIVVVVGPATGPALEYHIERCWPSSLEVRIVLQTVPLGTAHAALCAREAAGDGAFAVVNADDIYGVPALTTLSDHLRAGGGPANVTYRLADTIVSLDPVTRGTCVVDADGWLRQIVERRKVTSDGAGRFRSDDGLEPAELDGDGPVSVNLWGLVPSLWPMLEEAVGRVHPDLRADGTPARDLASDEEVLLPEVVGTAVAEGGLSVRALSGEGRCIGVTHADDLPIVRAELAALVGEGGRDEALWRVSA